MLVPGQGETSTQYAQPTTPTTMTSSALPATGGLPIALPIVALMAGAGLVGLAASRRAR